MKKTLFLLAIFILLNQSSVLAKSLEETFSRAEELFNAGKYQKAIRYYEDVVEIDPNFAPAYNGLGLAHKALNTDLAQVAWLFKTATEIDPKFVQAHDNLCKIYYNMGEQDKAEASCLEALSIYPNLVSSQLSLGWIYLIGKSDPSKAIQYFSEVLKSHKIPYAYFGLGMAYFMDDNRPMLLETITALRAMREDKLAQQLEGVSRQQRYSKSTSPIPQQDVVEVPKKQPGTLVGDFGESVATEEEAPTKSLGTSAMRVRLRGRMSGTGTSDEAQAPSGAIPTEETSTAQSRIERVRNLRNNYQGSRPSSKEATQRMQLFQQRGY